MEPSPDASGVPEVESHFSVGLSRLGLQGKLKPGAAGERAALGDARAARYVFEGELGRGGMGVVYRVHDRDLHRTLAMKVAGAPGAPAPDPVMLERFLEEAQVTGQLDHPGIVPLHELGIDSSGRVYFTMRLVKGQHLGEVIRLVHEGSADWTLERALIALIKTCEAMAYAHSKGVVHRDLKPGNVMTGRFGEVYVMDWGLAKVQGGAPAERVAGDAQISRSLVRVRRPTDEEGSGLVTIEGSVFGTPLYMAPEQARGEVTRVDRRSDLYSVGAILYHLLAGQPPYTPPGTRVSASTVLKWVVEGPPQRLRELAPRAPVDLVAICERTMSRDPEGRYQDMLELAEDLRSYLRGRPVGANPLGPLERTLRWSRRNPGVAGFLVVLPLAIAIAFWALSSLSTGLVQRTALDSAAAEARMLEDVNVLYSETVVNRVDKQAVPVTHDFASVPGAIPLPATFLTSLAETLSSYGQGNFVRHYSDWPFKFRTDGGPRDDFEKEALIRLQARPKEPYWAFENVHGTPSLRYATARIMKQSCVDCHNAHPESRRHDWKEGDVRGVLEIVRPLDQNVGRLQLAGTATLVGGLVFGLLALSAFLLVRQSRAGR